MNLEQFAQRIDGRESPLTLTTEEQAAAKEHRLCALTGRSDDMLQIWGLCEGNVYVYDDDASAWISEKGFFYIDENADECGMGQENADEFDASIKIKAKWLGSGPVRWVIEAPDAPSAKFTLTDGDGDPFCQGVVIQLPSA